MAKILVVDDEVGMGRIFERLLSGRAEVTATTTGEEALQLVDEERFDVILCDLNMPTMSGVEFYRALEDRGINTDRVAFITGGAFTEEDQGFVEDLTHPVLYKPFGIKELHALIDDMLTMVDQS